MQRSWVFGAWPPASYCLSRGCEGQHALLAGKRVEGEGCRRNPVCVGGWVYTCIETETPYSELFLNGLNFRRFYTSPFWAVQSKLGGSNEHFHQWKLPTILKRIGKYIILSMNVIRIPAMLTRIRILALLCGLWFHRIHTDAHNSRLNKSTD